MTPLPPGDLLSCKDCPNEPSTAHNPVNFCHPQFPQHMQFLQPPYAMNIPSQQFPQQPMYPPNVQYVVVQPQYSQYSLPPASPRPLSPFVMTSTLVSDLGTPRMETCPDNISVMTSTLVSGKGKMTSSSSEVEKDIHCSSDLQTMLKTNREEMERVQLPHSDQNLGLSRIEQPERKGSDAIVSEEQPESLITGVSSSKEFLPGSAGSSKFSEYQHGRALREDEPEKETLEQDYNAPDHNRAPVRDKLSGKETYPQDCKKQEYDGVLWGNVPESATGSQSCKVTKLKRKRKGNALPCLPEVQEDIKCAVDLQTMLRKDHEKMSEVQLRLSKEKLEFAKLKQQEAKDKKERTVHKNYVELLMADTSRFSDFQKAEYEKAVRRMGEMLFGRDDS